MDYSGLVAAVLRRLGPEKGDAASGMRRYVEMAEDQLYRRLRHGLMVQNTLPITPDLIGESSLPKDFLQVIAVLEGNEEVPHQSSSLEQKNPAYGSYYFIEGTVIIVRGVKSSYVLRYYRRMPSILSTAPQDQADKYKMLNAEPELFVNAMVVQAMQDLGRNGEYALEQSKLMDQIDEVNERNRIGQNVRRRVSGLAMYSGRIGG